MYPQYWIYYWNEKSTDLFTITATFNKLLTENICTWCNELSGKRFMQYIRRDSPSEKYLVIDKESIYLSKTVIYPLLFFPINEEISISSIYPLCSPLKIDTQWINLLSKNVPEIKVCKIDPYVYSNIPNCYIDITITFK